MGPLFNRVSFVVEGGAVCGAAVHGQSMSWSSWGPLHYDPVLTNIGLALKLADKKAQDVSTGGDLAILFQQVELYSHAISKFIFMTHGSERSRLLLLKSAVWETSSQRNMTVVDQMLTLYCLGRKKNINK